MCNGHYRVAKGTTSQANRGATFILLFLSPKVAKPKLAKMLLRQGVISSNGKPELNR